MWNCRVRCKVPEAPRNFKIALNNLRDFSENIFALAREGDL
jgi:hypothetical protein